MDAAMTALKPGGRLVANAVTLEMEAMLLALQARAWRPPDPHRRLARRPGRLHAGLARGHAGHAMVVGKAVIVAGIGSRKGVTASEVLAAIDAALAAHGLGRDALTALATTDFKRDETGIFEAGERLGWN